MKKQQKMNNQNDKKVRNLTEGPIAKQLVLFALPFLASSMIQQLYNTVDLMYVGKILGKNAAAAVGSSSLLVNCMVNFFVGLSVGVGVVTGHRFGNNDTEGLSKVVHTSAAITLIGSVVLSLIGWLGSPFFLKWMNTPIAIQKDAVDYIRIYFLSVFSIISYNVSSGILRALGNSKMPMLFQLFGGIVNVIADTFFIIVLHLNVIGAALATLLSQTTAAVMTIVYLCKLDDAYRLKIHKIRIYGRTLWNILSVGIPAGIQAMIITLSNVFVQTQINSLGVESIAAFSAFSKTDSFLYLPTMAFSQANSNFAGQNFGANKWNRARKGARITLLLGCSVALIGSILILTFNHQMIGLFAKEKEVIELGVSISKVVVPLYFLYMVMEVLAGTVRATGKALPPMIIIICNMFLVRLGCLIVMMRLYHTVQGIARIYPITWICTIICLAVYYYFGKWKPGPSRHFPLSKSV